MAQKRLKVALVEVPAVDIELDGERILDDFTLNHPKYPQLILAANLAKIDDVQIELSVVDLKGGGVAESVAYGSIDYCGQRLGLQRVGVPFEHEQDRLSGADIVGISANFTFERSVVIQTIDFLRRQSQPPLIVVGGHDATVDPEYYLRRSADLCVLGEGESALPEIVRAVAGGVNPDVEGTASLHQGSLKKGRRRRAHLLSDIAFPDLEMLRATDFHESPDGPLPLEVAPRITALETSRGCPEACSFCDISFVVGGFRSVPFEVLVDQVKTFKAAGIRTIQIIDDNLLYRLLPSVDGERGRQTIIDLFALLYAEGFAWEFFNGFQVGLFEKDGRIDRELINALYRNGYRCNRFVGCFRSYVPLDKVTIPELSLLTKLKPLPIAEAVIQAIAECQVPALNLGFVIGNIRETPGSLDETVEWADKFRQLVIRASSGRTCPAVLFLCSVPLPGTPDFRFSGRQNIFPPDEYPELYNIFMSVLKTDHYSPLELTRQRQHMMDLLNREVRLSAKTTSTTLL